MTTRTGRVLHLLGELEYRFLELGLIIFLVLNGLAIFSRYVLNHAIGELFEIMVLGSVALYWLGSATAERGGGHLGMDFLVGTFPAGLRRVTDLIRRVIIVGFLLVVAYSGWKLSMSQIRFGANSGLLDIPMWIFSGFLPFSAALMAIRVILPKKRTETVHEVMV